MNRILFAILCGIAFGMVAVALMLPMSFPDKRVALLAAFTSRFAVGFCAATVQVQLPSWLTGAIVGFLISLPDAIVTKTYTPILVIGTLGGLIVAIAASKWAA